MAVAEGEQRGMEERQVEGVCKEAGTSSSLGCCCWEQLGHNPEEPPTQSQLDGKKEVAALYSFPPFSLPSSSIPLCASSLGLL